MPALPMKFNESGDMIDPELHDAEIFGIKHQRDGDDWVVMLSLVTAWGQPMSLALHGVRAFHASEFHSQNIVLNSTVVPADEIEMWFLMLCFGRHSDHNWVGSEREQGWLADARAGRLLFYRIGPANGMALSALCRSIAVASQALDGPSWECLAPSTEGK
jgi:hypothetical protein